MLHHACASLRRACCWRESPRLVFQALLLAGCFIRIYLWRHRCCSLGRATSDGSASACGCWRNTLHRLYGDTSWHSQAGLIHAASASHLSSPSAPTSFFHRMSYGAMSASASSIPSGRNLTVAVLGSTGGIGRNVVKHALAHPDIGKVIAIVRRARPADMGQGVADPKLQEVVVDFANLTAEPFAGASIVYCCLGSTIAAAGSQEEFKKQDHDLILRCGEKAREAESVQQFCLVSSVGADPHTGNFYLKTKGQIEDGLKALHFPRLAIYKPSVLDAPREKLRCGECFGLCCVKCACGPCVWCCCRQYEAIKVSDVALAMVTESLMPEAPKERTQPGGVTLFDGSGVIVDFLKAQKAGAPAH